MALLQQTLLYVTGSRKTNMVPKPKVSSSQLVYLVEMEIHAFRDSPMLTAQFNDAIAYPRKSKMAVLAAPRNRKYLDLSDFTR